MAAVTHRNSNPVTTNAPATYVSGAFTPAVNDLLVVLFALDGSTASPTVTDDQGGTYTLINSALKSSSADVLRLYVRDTLVSSAVSHTVTLTATFTGSTGACVAVASISGMSRTGAAAVRQSAIRENRGAEAIAVTFAAAVLTGNPVIAFFGNSTNPAGVTPPSTFTEALDTGHATPTKGLEYAFVNSGFTGTVVTWGSVSASVCGAICAEFDTSLDPRRAQVYWAELEVPNAPRRAQVYWAELETPDAPRRAQVYFAELEAPNAPRRAQVYWAELELPDAPVAPRRAQVYFAELELPDAPRRAQVYFAELEAPNAPRRAQVYWAELEVPSPVGGPTAWLRWDWLPLPESVTHLLLVRTLNLKLSQLGKIHRQIQAEADELEARVTALEGP